MFGTNFAVSGSRTTQGVWTAILKNEGKVEPVIVLNVEGTDSRECGEEDLAFERKTSLFSLVYPYGGYGRYLERNLEAPPFVNSAFLDLFDADFAPLPYKV
eukprot:TRINITY_DN269_c0_g2_i1.p1 TRINITY_DN269_c0_g2~~TRINITY_DN269_c0_g2_i1.p1  ORF type:complete len:101 (+),score=21.46 TRINITY_DN269_c0_g2_i1:1327-1629(+)